VVEFLILLCLFLTVLMYYMFIQWAFASSCDHRCDVNCVVLVYCYFKIVLLLFCHFTA
jgi:hypothetical protein